MESLNEIFYLHDDNVIYNSLVYLKSFTMVVLLKGATVHFLADPLLPEDRSALMQSEMFSQMNSISGITDYVIDQCYM